MTNSQAETIRVGSGIRGIHLVAFIIALSSVLFTLFWASDQQRVRNFLSSFQVLKIDTVDIKSEWPLSISKVEEWVSHLKGENILLLDANKVVENLKTQPWVESVAINKGYPNRVQIILTTKKPEAIVFHKGQPWFVDPSGALIEKVSSQMMKGLDIPFLSFEASSPSWNVSEFLEQYEKIKSNPENKFTVSQIVLGKFPYFKTYLSQPKIEVVWSFENWESQVEHLNKLILNPPSQVGQLRRINLVFPKKAIVSSTISH
jgi:cell division septal protein FtsQ